ncbi:NUDIX domain-containing protein [Haloarchaeobius amylolyticus]|uniref:NUDIX domain-containing protein n=1 Tax=Haloarchaeobius amylolyticus TaxID=1198296 RepID=UPI002270EED2|nr:NUDIX domain-containing protein [Haloarchaeobius amylolyticus]
MTYPEDLLDRGSVDYVEQTHVLPAEEFEAARDRAETIDGGVVVGVTDDEDRVLLVQNDWSDGWILPGGGVEPGEDWEAAARREAEEETGVAVTLDGPELVYQGRLEHVDTGEVLEDGYAVFFAASPRDDGTVADDPGVADEDIQAVEWFAAVPADVDPDHEAEVRRFVDGAGP